MTQKKRKKTVVVAALNWGLGHVTRCVPIIRALTEHKCHLVLVSDGLALEWWDAEFPDLKKYALSSLSITYSKSLPQYLKLGLTLPRLIRKHRDDRKLWQALEREIQPDLIISDNVPAVFSEVVPSYYITHQLTVKSGIFTPIVSFLHAKSYARFTKVLVPDSDTILLSGALSRYKGVKPEFLGVLSRFEMGAVGSCSRYDYLFLISGPEPLRSEFEESAIAFAKQHQDKRIALVRGTNQVNQHESYPNICFHDLLNTVALKELILTSEVVIARSGYSTVMDLFKLRKKALLVPTPGQGEQLYLAEYLEQKGYFRTCKASEICSYDMKKLFRAPDPIGDDTKELQRILRQLLEC